MDLLKDKNEASQETEKKYSQQNGDLQRAVKRYMITLNTLHLSGISGIDFQ